MSQSDSLIDFIKERWKVFYFDSLIYLITLFITENFKLLIEGKVLNDRERFAFLDIHVRGKLFPQSIICGASFHNLAHMFSAVGSYHRCTNLELSREASWAGSYFNTFSILHHERKIVESFFWILVKIRLLYAE